MPTHSYAYRNNEQDILEKRPPLKYVRILPYVPGDNIIEIGSAEGVLALLLTEEKQHVTAVETRNARHEAALELCKAWGSPPNVKFVDGDITECLNLLDGKDTLVAIRMIYHLKEGAKDVIAEAARVGVKNVVLGGNRSRERQFLSGMRQPKLGEYEGLATRRGMTEILKAHGYSIAKESFDEDDPIVVGVR